MEWDIIARIRDFHSFYDRGGVKAISVEAANRKVTIPSGYFDQMRAITDFPINSKQHPILITVVSEYENDALPISRKVLFGKQCTWNKSGEKPEIVCVDTRYAVVPQERRAELIHHEVAGILGYEGDRESQLSQLYTGFLKPIVEFRLVVPHLYSLNSDEKCSLYFYFGGFSSMESGFAVDGNNRYFGFRDKTIDGNNFEKTLAQLSRKRRLISPYDYPIYREALEAKGYTLSPTGKGRFEVHWTAYKKLNLGYPMEDGDSRVWVENRFVFDQIEMTDVDSGKKRNLITAQWTYGTKFISSTSHSYGGSTTSRSYIPYFHVNDLKRSEISDLSFGSNAIDPIRDEISHRYSEAKTPAEKTMIEQEWDLKYPLFRKFTIDPIMLMIERLPYCGEI